MIGSASDLCAKLESLEPRSPHPQIVPTITAGEHDGHLYLAMAYVEGVDLSELLRREGRLEAQRAVELISEVADAPRRSPCCRAPPERSSRETSP
jgi:serine/threonine protein kinase